MRRQADYGGLPTDGRMPPQLSKDGRAIQSVSLLLGHWQDEPQPGDSLSMVGSISGVSLYVEMHVWKGPGAR